MPFALFTFFKASVLQSILVSALPIFISLAIFAGTAVFAVYLQNRKQKGRWSPLTTKLLRGPGHKLVQELDDINWDISANLFLSWVAPLIIYATHISTSYFSNHPESASRIAINIGAVLLMEIYLIRKLLSLFDARSKIREGYEAESAVGSELNQLMLDGAYVFHDLQAEGFNIDHVVVSPRGVFCVETKSRVKYVEVNSKADAKLQFDGTALKFPSHAETAPVEQARANAKWVKNWLSQAVGEPIEVKPVLALPGWYVTSTARSNVVVINGKNCRGIFASLPPLQMLDDTMLKRVVYQVEQRCRDVEPTRYRKGAMALGAIGART